MRKSVTLKCRWEDTKENITHNPAQCIKMTRKNLSVLFTRGAGNLDTGLIGRRELGRDAGVANF